MKIKREKRKNDQMREISIEHGVIPSAEGSCLVKFGNTHVICTASVEESVPRFLKNTGSGWVTAEYGMLPRSTETRMQREASSSKQAGRTVEIQRLIGRSLRGAVDLKKLGSRQIIIDCDVINADGGTRTAAITGGYIALELAIQHIMKRKIIKHNPLLNRIVAVSCGIVGGNAMLDLNYLEDSSAEVDANFVFNDKNNLIEVQATGESKDFTSSQLIEMMQLATQGAKQLLSI